MGLKIGTIRASPRGSKMKQARRRSNRMPIQKARINSEGVPAIPDMNTQTKANRNNKNTMKKERTAPNINFKRRE